MKFFRQFLFYLKDISQVRKLPEKIFVNLFKGI